MLGEVKNVSKMHYSIQLRDYVTWAKANDFKVILMVRPTTKLTKPLQEAVDRGDIILTYLP